jgi:hypothetical protein
MNLKILIAIFLLMVLTACNPGLSARPGQEIDIPAQASTAEPGQNPSREVEARSAVVDFYDNLNQGAYDQAAGLYGGSYEVLQGYNPGIDPGDRASLLEAGCKFNGLMCLRVLDLTLIHADEPREFIFSVVFANPDGSQFVLGPCCGATEEEMPPVTLFNVHVTCEQDGACRVLDLPPYVP